jgi:hypothetical protein
MSHKFQVEKLLSDADFEKFCDLLIDRRTVIDEAVEWLNAHGYKICRTAVANYRRHLNEKSLFRLRPTIGIGDDATARRRLAGWANRLSGQSLTSLVFYAAYLINVEAVAGRNWPGRIAGLAKVQPLRHRRNGVSKRR